ncbi:MAG: hypothetical protein FWG47_06880 [Propionibacteriaceae bacterium]|nr:hypothetical protein [Propionibacteriaceae bacterium]
MGFSLLFVIALILGLLLPAVAQLLLRRMKLVDVPSDRSSHSQPTLRGGGIAPAVVIVIGWGLGLALGLVQILISNVAAPGVYVWIGEANPASTGTVIVAGAVLFAGLGFVEDVRQLSVTVRLALQGLLGIVMGAALLVSLQWPLWLVPVFCLAAIFAVNASNFMDGINGISSYQGAILGVAAVIVGLLWNATGLVVLGVVIFGAFVGFLPWNFPKARLFLGDVGSYLLGGLFFGVGIWMWAATDSILVGLAPLAVYATDVCVTLVRRALQGKKLTQSHREHAYQLLAVNSSHTLVTMVATVASLAVVSVAIASRYLHFEVFGVLLIGVLVAAYEVGCLLLASSRRSASAG